VEREAHGNVCGSSAVSASEPSVPGRSNMEALTISAGCGSGFADHPTSATGWCSMTTLSTSKRPMRWSADVNIIIAVYEEQHCVAIRSNRLGSLGLGVPVSAKKKSGEFSRWIARTPGVLGGMGCNASSSAVRRNPRMVISAEPILPYGTSHCGYLPAASSRLRLQWSLTRTRNVKGNTRAVPHIDGAKSSVCRPIWVRRPSLTNSVSLTAASTDYYRRHRPSDEPSC
jgi:hypothetical protein